MSDRLVHVEEVWDTVVSLHLHGPHAEAARDAIVAWLHEVDRTLSTFRPETRRCRAGARASWRSTTAPPTSARSSRSPGRRRR